MQIPCFRLLAGLTSLAAAAGSLLLASDHREAPLVQKDPPADIADLYAFHSPAMTGNLVLVMTVNPLSVPTEAHTYHFSPDVNYLFFIDNTGDSVEDQFISVTFGDYSLGGSQTMEVNFNDVVKVSGVATAPTTEPTPNPPVINTTPFGASFFAGPRDDPFFFDVVGFNRVLAGTGSFSGVDSFAHENVSAIVVEVPLQFLAPNNEKLQLWSVTARQKLTVRRSSSGQLEVESGSLEQVERAANPAVATALIPAGRKDLFNIGRPADDPANFAGDIVASLTALGTNSTNIGILASIAVPDTLKFDPALPSGYPNGRRLADDVIDTLFDLIFNTTGVSDLVNANDKPFSSVFPYLADPFTAP